MKQSLLSALRLRFLRQTIQTIYDEKISGCIAECGVFRGGSAGEMGRAMLAQKDFRPMYLFDSFSDMPIPGEDDIDRHGRHARTLPNRGMPQCSDPYQDCVKFLTDECKLPMHHIRMVQGWFDSTLAKTKTGKIALLHVDADFYEPVKCCLTHMAPRVSEHGFIIIDDYGHWNGCRRAVNQWLMEHGMSIDDLTHVGSTAVYWRKQE